MMGDGRPKTGDGRGKLLGSALVEKGEKC